MVIKHNDQESDKNYELNIISSFYDTSHKQNTTPPANQPKVIIIAYLLIDL